MGEEGADGGDGGDEEGADEEERADEGKEGEVREEDLMAAIRMIRPRSLGRIQEMPVHQVSRYLLM